MRDGREVERKKFGYGPLRRFRGDGGDEIEDQMDSWGSWGLRKTPALVEWSRGLSGSTDPFGGLSSVQFQP